jgi:integrase
MAARERQAAEEAEKNGAPVKPSEMKLKDAVAEWLKTLDVRPRTHDGYKASAEMYGRLLGEEKLVSSITFADVEKLFSDGWKGSAGRTKIAHVQLLRRLFGWCADHGYTKANPAAKVKIQKSWTREASRAAHETGQALTIREARKLLEACRDKVSINFTPEALRNGSEKETDITPPSYLGDFVFIALRTGLRMSNILESEHKPGLIWRNVDIKKGILFIEGGLMKNHLDFHVPIHAELLDWLGRRLKRLGRVPRPEEPIVAHAGELKRSFSTALKRAGFAGRDFRVHDLRHSYLSWLGEHCPHAVMQVLAGHSAHSITDRYTQHQDIEKLREWLDKLEWLEGAPVPAKGKARKRG